MNRIGFSVTAKRGSVYLALTPDVRATAGAPKSRGDEGISSPPPRLRSAASGRRRSSHRDGYHGSFASHACTANLDSDAALPRGGRRDFKIDDRLDSEDSEHWHPKTASEQTRQVLDALQAILAARPDAESRLFPFTSQQIARFWTRSLKRAGVRYSKPHTLRHAFASILLSRGCPVLYLVKAGGWKDATTPLRVYAKWVPGSDPALGSTQPAQQADPSQPGLDGKSAPLLLDHGPDWSRRALHDEVPAARPGDRAVHARGNRARSLLEERGHARAGRVRGRAAGRAVPRPLAPGSPGAMPPGRVVWTGP